MEIVDEIFSQLQLSSQAALRNCLAVNRFWYQRARPFVYRDIVLDTNLHSLLRLWDVLNREDTSLLVKSLTLRHHGTYLDNGELMSFTGRICRLLVKLNRLASFSFIVLESSDRFYIPYDQLADLIDCLPETCVNLELDTGCSRPTAVDPHLCPRLRQILPRMKHVRLSLKHMCPAMFGKGSIESAFEDEAEAEAGGGEDTQPYYTPISLPRIESLLLHLDDSYVCDRRIWTGISRARGDDDDDDYAWIVFCKALEQLVKNDSCPPSAKLRVFDKVDADDVDLDEYDTFLCAEPRTQVTWAIPHRRCRISEKESSYMVRLPDGRELFGGDNFSVVEGLAEGEVWKTLVSGARLPAALVDGQVWYNERKAGCRVLEPEKREGPDKYLSRAVIVEDTPPGFHRLTYEALWELHRDGSETVHM
jgi:hypothetical protein